MSTCKTPWSRQSPSVVGFSTASLTDNHAVKRAAGAISVRTKLLPTVAEVGSILMASGGTVDPEVARKHLAIRALFTYLKQAGPDDAKWPSLAALTAGRPRASLCSVGRTTDGCWVAAENVL